MRPMSLTLVSEIGSIVIKNLGWANTKTQVILTEGLKVLWLIILDYSLSPINRKYSPLGVVAL